METSMTNFSKLIVASALLASFAVPAFAATANIESKIADERFVAANAQPNTWARAYAMETRANTAPATNDENLSSTK
jgi:hypothetical protein